MYICKICKYKTKDIPDKCPICGNSGKNIWETAPKPILNLKGPGGNEIIVFEDRKKINRETLRIFGKDMYQYVNSEVQFVLEFDYDESKWKIIGIKEVKNPTYFNDETLLSGEKFLENNDKIKIGPLELNVEID